MGDKTKTGKYYRTPAQIRKDKALERADNKARKLKQAELRDINQNFRRDGSRDPVKSKLGKNKKVIKKVLKKVPGPIGSVARVGSIARKLSNAAKNAKNLKPLRKGVGFPKATKQQMKSFKKAMDLKSPALKKVYEANKKAVKQVKRKGTYLDKKKLRRGKEKFKAKQRQKNKLYHF